MSRGVWWKMLQLWVRFWHVQIIFFIVLLQQEHEAWLHLKYKMLKFRWQIKNEVPVHRYEREPNSEPPFDPLPAGPSSTWRSLVTGLLRVAPSRRFNYLDTLQHPALAHLKLHSIRDQVNLLYCFCVYLIYIFYLIYILMLIFFL